MCVLFSSLHSHLNKANGFSAFTHSAIFSQMTLGWLSIGCYEPLIFEWHKSKQHIWSICYVQMCNKSFTWLYSAHRTIRITARFHLMANNFRWQIHQLIRNKWNHQESWHKHNNNLKKKTNHFMSKKKQCFFYSFEMKRFSRLMHSGKHRNKHYFFQAKVGKKNQPQNCLSVLSFS